MKRLLVITPDDELVDRIQHVVEETSAILEHVTTWDEGRDELIDRQYSATILDASLLDSGQPRAFVQLNDILTKESTRALLLSRGGADQLTQYVDHLDSFDAPLDADMLRRGKGSQRIIDLLESARTLSSSTSIGLEASTSEPTSERLEGPVNLQLPPLDKGSLADVSLARILFTAKLTRATGLLILTTNQITRRIALRDGDILDAIGENVSSLDQIPPIFAWSSGQYRFEPDLLEGAGLTDVVDVIARGVFDHMDQRRLMNELMEQMSGCVATVRRHVDVLPSGEWVDSVEQFLEHVDGRRTLEDVLSSTRSDTRQAFQAAYLALRTDRAVVTNSPMVSPIEVVYGHEDVAEGDEAARSAGAESSSPGLGESSSSVAEEQSRKSIDPERLEDLLERAEEANAYELIGAWEGCGSEVVRDRFIPLVKHFHPDRYEQSLDDKQQSSAQDLFMKIQEARESLISRESEQTASEPAPAPSSVLFDDRAEQRRRKKRPEDAVASQPNTDPNDSGVIGLGGRSDVDDFAREMGHRDSSTAETDHDESSDDMRLESQPGMTAGGETSSVMGDEPSDEAIALGGPQESNDEAVDESATDELSLGGESSATLETDEEPQPSPKHDANSLDETSETAEETSRRKQDERNEKVQRLRHNTNTSTANLAGGSSSSGRNTSATPRPSLGSPPTTDKQARDHFNYGYKALKAQNEETALKHLKLAHDYDSDNGLYKTFYGYALFQAHPDMRDEAQELLEEAIEIEHRQALPDAHLFLGRILRVKEEHDRAKSHFKESLDMNPDSKAAQRELRLYQIRDRKGGGSADSEPTDEGESVSFKDDPAGYLKNLLNRDLF